MNQTMFEVNAMGKNCYISKVIERQKKFYETVVLKFKF